MQYRKIDILYRYIYIFFFLQAINFSSIFSRFEFRNIHLSLIDNSFLFFLHTIDF